MKSKLPLLLVAAAALIFTSFLIWQNLPTGEREHFDIFFKNSMEHDLSLALGKDYNTQKQSVEIEFSADLSRETESQQDSFFWVNYQLAPRDLQFFSQKSPLPAAQKQDLEQQIARPFRARHRADGRLFEISCDTAISGTAESIQKFVACQFQFSRPVAAPSVWQTEESDAVGSARIIYEKSAADHFQKTKKDYLEIAGEYGGMEKPELIFSSKTELKIDASGHNFLKINTKENRLMKLKGQVAGNMNLVFTADFRTANSLNRRERDDQAALFASSNYCLPSAPFKNNALVKTKFARLRHLVVGTTPNQLLLEVAQAKEFDQNLFEKLVAAATVLPAAVPIFEKYLQQIAPQSLGFQLVTNALAKCHNAACQQVFVQILKEKGADWTTMSEILPQLALIEAPEKLLIEAVESLAFSTAADPNIPTTAQLTLGGMALRLREKSPDSAEKLTQNLISKLKNQVDEKQFLLVLGNSGAACALPEIRPFLSHANPEILATAIESLRFVADPMVDSLLQSFQKNGSMSISQLASSVLQQRAEQL